MSQRLINNNFLGFGSNLTWNKKIECEASIMESQTTNFGACTNVSNVANPIQLARKLCDKQSGLLKMGRIPPMILAGEGASEYARECGIKLVSSMDELISKKSLQCFDYYRKKISNFEIENNMILSPLDTVGAVSIDDEGNIAAGCSSGGLILKLSGRVGQASSYGAGCFAQQFGSKVIGTCTTGNGEYLMKTLLAREICTSLYNSDCPITQLHAIFNDKFLKSPLLPSREDLYGGALTIVYDQETNQGDILWSHTSSALCLAYKGTKMKHAKFVCSKLPDNVKAGTRIVISGYSFKL